MKTPNRTAIRVLMLGAGLDVKGGITSVEQLILRHAPSHLQIHHVATFGKGSALENIKIFLKAILILIQTGVRQRADVVHIHFSDRGSTFRKAILSAIAILLRQRFILHFHGAAYESFFAGLPMVLQRLIAAIFSRCDRLIALSESWRVYCMNTFHLRLDQAVVLMNPVHIPATIPDRSTHQLLTFVFLGRIGKRGGALDVAQSVLALSHQDKGAFDLIRAFAALPAADRQKARLVLAGNGDVEAAQALIHELGIAEQATVHAWLEPEQRDALLATADVFVLPSYNEGLPMSMLEAMAWGLPPIVTPVGGIPEVIMPGKNGLLVQPGNPAELVAAMQRLIHDESLRSSLGQRARATVQAFDVNTYMMTLVELYETALASEPVGMSQSVEG